MIRSTPQDFADHHPTGADLTLVVEIADSSLRLDRLIKAKLYANAGVTEYWVVDVGGRKIFVYRQPQVGGYREFHEYAETDKIATLESPSAEIEIGRLFPNQSATR